MSILCSNRGLLNTYSWLHITTFLYPTKIIYRPTSDSLRIQDNSSAPLQCSSDNTEKVNSYGQQFDIDIKELWADGTFHYPTSMAPSSHYNHWNGVFRICVIAILDTSYRIIPKVTSRSQYIFAAFFPKCLANLSQQICNLSFLNYSGFTT